MIQAVHTLIYARDATKARAFFRDILKLKFVDAMDGWLIFALPAAELGIHPVDSDGPPTSGRHTLSLMCDDIDATVQELKQKGVQFTRAIKDEGWGITTALKVPGAGEIQLYQPRHKSPLNLKPASRKARKPTKAGTTKKSTRTAPPARKAKRSR